MPGCKRAPRTAAGGANEVKIVNFARVLKEVVWCLVTEGGISSRRIKALLDELRELVGVS